MEDNTSKKINKSWAENTQEEKVEILRNEIINLQTNLSGLGDSLSRIHSQIHQLKYHSHADGKVVVSIENTGAVGQGLVGGQSLARRNPLM